MSSMMMNKYSAAPAPLSDCTAATLHQANIPQPRKQQIPTTPAPRHPAPLSSRKYSHNPYAEVLPETIDEMIRELEFRKHQVLRRAYSQPVLRGQPATPLSPIYQRHNSVSAFGEELESLAGSFSEPPTPTYPVRTAAPKSPVQPEPTQRPRSPVATDPSVVLTKVYHNGRPVPRVRTDGHDSSVESVEPPAPPKIPVDAAVVMVQFRRNVLPFRTSGNVSHLEPGQHVIVDGDRGIDLGVVVEAAKCPPEEVTATIQRLASESEIAQNDALLIDEARALEFAQLSAARNIPNQKLSIEHVVFQFDKQKLTLFYKSPERVYFVPLLKVLNSQYKCRIWMERLEE